MNTTKTQNDLWIKNVKKGAGRNMASTWLVIVVIYIVTACVTAFFFKQLFGMPVVHSQGFVIGCACVLAMVLLLWPVLYAYGYNSKKMQRKYLGQKVDSINQLIRYYEKSKEKMEALFRELPDNFFSHLHTIVTSSVANTDEFKIRSIESKEAVIARMKERFVQFKKEVRDAIEEAELSRLENSLEKTVESVYDDILDSVTVFNNIQHDTVKGFEEAREKYMNQQWRAYIQYESRCNAEIISYKEALQYLESMIQKHYA